MPLGIGGVQGLEACPVLARRHSAACQTSRDAFFDRQMGAGTGGLYLPVFEAPKPAVAPKKKGNTEFGAIEALLGLTSDGEAAA